MFKYILANLRWGKISSEELEVLDALSFREVAKRPYLCPKLLKHYG